VASSQFNVVKNNLEGAVYEGDLNNATTGGVYSITGSNVTNRPAEMTGSGSLMVLDASSILIHQVIFLGDSIIYMRRCAYGGWSGWTKTTLTPVT